MFGKASGWALAIALFAPISLYPQSTPDSTPVISHITLDRRNIFDDTESSWITRLVNRLHVRTHAPVIRREFLFAVGDPYDSAKVAETKRTCVLVVETRTKDETLTLGVIADAVSEVVDLANDDIEPAPAFGTGVKLDHITGMGKVGKGFVILLDIDRVLTASDADLAAATLAAAQAAADALPQAKQAQPVA